MQWSGIPGQVWGANRDGRDGDENVVTYMRTNEEIFDAVQTWKNEKSIFPVLLKTLFAEVAQALNRCAAEYKNGALIPAAMS